MLVAPSALLRELYGSSGPLDCKMSLPYPLAGTKSQQVSSLRRTFISCIALH